MPDLKPWEKAAKQQGTTELKPWEVAASKKKDLTVGAEASTTDLPTGGPTLQNGSLPFQTPVNTEAPSVLTPQGQADYNANPEKFLGTPEEPTPIPATIYQRAKAIGYVNKEKPAVKDQGILNTISQALYIPSFNKGFNDLITKPLAGATSFVDRTIDKAYQAITGEETPSWLRKGGAFDKIVTHFDKDFEKRDKPSGLVSEVTESMVGMLPLIASLSTGQGEANLLAQAPHVFGKLTKVLGVTGALNSYEDATKEGKGYMESLGEMSKGGVEGVKSGLTLEAQMLVGGALGGGTAKILADRGLLKGKTAEAVLRALSVGTVFGGTSAGEDLLAGRDIDTRKAMHQFGIGLAFEIIPTAKAIGHDIGAKRTENKLNDIAAQNGAMAQSASNLNSEGVLRTLITTPKEQLVAINNEIQTPHSELYANSIESGVKTFDAKNPQEKRSHLTDQLVQKTQGDVKLMSEKINENYDEIVKEISESEELTPEVKADLLGKIEALTVKPKEEPTNAIQEPGASSVLQSPQERVGETGSERVGVEPVLERTTSTEKSPDQAVQEGQTKEAVSEEVAPVQKEIATENENIDLALESSQATGEFEGKTTDQLLEDKKLLADNPKGYFEQQTTDFLRQLEGNISDGDRQVLEQLYTDYDKILRKISGISDSEVDAASQDLFDKKYSELTATEKDNALYEASGRKDLVSEAAPEEAVAAEEKTSGFTKGDKVSFTNNLKEADTGEIVGPQNGDGLWPVRKSNGVTTNMSPEQLTKISEPTTQESTQDRKSGLAKERIQVQRSAPSGTPKKLNKIIGDLSNALKATLIYAKSRRRNSAGSYNPINALVNIRNAGDIDTAAHEMGHLLDDRFDLLGAVPSGVEAQLKWFSDRGGSNPPSGMKGKAAQTYREREGLAEFIRAYIANPAEAKATAPELFEHFENTIDAKTLQAIKDFSKDYIDFANASAGDQILANILETPDLKEKPSVVEWLKGHSNSKDKFSIGWYDNLKSHVANSLHAAEKAFNYAKNLKDIGTLLPEKNFETLARVFAGENGKIDRIFDSGLVDSKNNFLKDNGKNMTVNWLMEPLDNTSKESLDKEVLDVIKYMVAQRTVEYAKKFGRTNSLSGIGGGVKSDIFVATEHLTDFEQLKTDNPAKAKRIEEAARRYRKYADEGLKYALDKGRLSQEQYDVIKEGNKYYVSLARVSEVAPEQEPLAFVSQFSKGGLGTVKEVIKKAKGGTGLIQNPYISLLKNTSDLINESDRNAVLQNFVEVLTENRNMGEGELKELAQIGRKVTQGEKNTKTVFVDGKPQKWQFQEDVYKALTAMEADNSTGILAKAGQMPGKLLRWSVTHFPAFAAKNLIRDTQQRLIQSRSNGGFKDIIHNLSDREIFDLYGGSQAGMHLTSRESYYDRMVQSVKDLTDKGGLVLDPRKIGELSKSYVKFLEKSENVNRIAEFKSAFKQAKKQGMDDYNAGIYAAYQGRDLLDFAVAGHTIRSINKYVPFTNAAVQGLRRTIIGVKEAPAAFAIKMSIYSIIPQVLVHALNIYNGDEDEYEELPFYQRDLFYNFKTPLTGDKWVSIPKPFDLGLVSSGVDRAISSAREHKNVFDKFGKSMYSVLSPLDESTLTPGVTPLVEIMTNKDMYRDQSIVPEWEENLMLSKRKGTKYASNLGKMLSEGFGLVGVEVDPRYIDHAVKGFASYYGDFGMRLSNIGSENGKKIGIEQTGLVRERPIANALDVTATFDLAEKLGKERTKGIKDLKDAVGTFYDLKTEKDRTAQAEKIYELSKKQRVILDKEFEAEPTRDKSLDEIPSEIRTITRKDPTTGDMVTYNLAKEQVEERIAQKEKWVSRHGAAIRSGAFKEAKHRYHKSDSESRIYAEKAVNEAANRAITEKFYNTHKKDLIPRE